MRIGEYPERPAQRTDDGDRDRAGWPHAAVDTPLSPDPLDTSEAQILLQLGFGKPLVAAMAERAARYGTTIEQELLGDGWIDPDAYYAALARMLRLPYLMPKALQTSAIWITSSFSRQPSACSMPGKHPSPSSSRKHAAFR